MITMNAFGVGLVGAGFHHAAHAAAAATAATPASVDRGST
jgi:hypothetical protein